MAWSSGLPFPLFLFLFFFFPSFLFFPLVEEQRKRYTRAITNPLFSPSLFFFSFFFPLSKISDRERSIGASLLLQSILPPLLPPFSFFFFFFFFFLFILLRSKEVYPIKPCDVRSLPSYPFPFPPFFFLSFFFFLPSSSVDTRRTDEPAFPPSPLFPFSSPFHG